MKPGSILGLLGLTTLSQAAGIKRDYANNDYYVLHLERSTPPEDVALRLGLEHQGQLGDLTDHYVFRATKSADDIVKTEIRERKRRKRDVGGHDILDGVLLARKQEPRRHLEKRIVPPRPANMPLKDRAQSSKPLDWAIAKQQQVMHELDIKDPIFKDQWHLLNTIEVGHDVNVTGVWSAGVTGQNVTVAIIDDGLDMYSQDLSPNYFADGSWDFNDHDPEPKPTLDDDKHGTRCAGEVAAAKNDVCGVGVAYDAKIAGIRILSGELTNADEAEAMIYKSQLNHIYSCSWGPPDDGRHMEAPDVLIRRAILKGVQEGREGKGSIYVFASGNGALHDDNCNFDGYTNSIYSITVGAVDRMGKHPFYSEHCSANLVVTYSSGSGDSIHTTDVGANKCYSGHGGTSAAAPLAAGIFALVLQVRPDLTWRDLQYLALNTAAHVEDTTADWQQTSIGKQFSHTFGYGKVDSYAMVEMARTWQLVKPQAWFFSPWLHVKQPIPEGNQGLEVKFEVTADMLKEANVERLEHVTVTMNVEHSRRGDLSVDLISPANVISHIATARKQDDFRGGYDDWTFMSVVHWGELGVGTWTLIIRDTNANEHQGTFTDWHLKLWGEAIDPAAAKLLPMPTEDDDADHDAIIVSTATSPGITATALPNPEQTHDHQVPHPSEHPVRPTKPAAKPTETDETDSTSTEAEAATTSTSWISWLPTLGTSRTTQMWIYSSVGSICAFGLGLAIYLYIARRKQLRNSNSRNNYEFEMLDEEEGEGLNKAEKAPGQRRGGELYDAFAGGSEDEDGFDSYSDRDEVEREEEQFGIGGESDDDEGRPLN